MGVSAGWENVAEQVISTRELSWVGMDEVERWAAQMPEGASVLDLGCGPGGPRSGVLASRGFLLHAIDASPSLAAAYSLRFPQARVACEPADETGFFARGFDGILAWGLLFLLPPAEQLRLIDRVANALNPEGRFLFTAPWQEGTWPDRLTGNPSVSLGGNSYRAALTAAGLTLVAEFEDDGDNHYYETRQL